MPGDAERRSREARNKLMPIDSGTLNELALAAQTVNTLMVETSDGQSASGKVVDPHTLVV